MLLFKLVKCANSLIKKAFGKFYARPVVTHTIGIAELAEHMASHNTPFSAGTIRGILTDMGSALENWSCRTWRSRLKTSQFSASVSDQRREPTARRSSAWLTILTE